MADLVRFVKEQRTADEIERVLYVGCAVNYLGCFNLQTPLHLCANYRDQVVGLEVVKLLINYGADINYRDHSGVTPLIQFVKSRCHHNLINVLLSCMADVNVRDKYGCCALSYYLYNERKSVIMFRRLMPKKAIVNMRYGYFQKTLIMESIKECCSKQYVELLLAGGARLTVRDKSGNTPLHCFGRKNRKVSDDSLEVLRLLIDCGINVNGVNKRQMTPLMSFVKNGLPFEHVKMLLDAGADVNRSDEYDYTVLHHFVHGYKTKNSESLNILKMLVCHGAPVDAKNRYLESPLMLLVRYGSPLDHIKVLLNKGVDVNASHHAGNSVLHYICNAVGTVYSFDCLILKLLLEYGADPNKKNAEDNPPLYYALRCKVRMRRYQIRLLINYGATLGFNELWAEEIILDNIYQFRDISFTIALRDRIIELNGDDQLPAQRITYTLPKIIAKYILLGDETAFDLYFEAANNFEDVPDVAIILSELNCELLKMKTYYVREGHTLFGFLKEMDPNKARLYLKNFDLDPTVVEAEFPNYFDVIKSKVEIAGGWICMLKVVERMAWISYRRDKQESDDTAVALNIDCIRHVTSYLNHSDINRFLIAAEGSC